MRAIAAPLSDPPHDCPLCPRLVAFRDRQREEHADWFNGPVPSFGPSDASLLIVGLAPGLRGANRTGRPFTGDYAGVLLYETLLKFGLASGRYRAAPDDGLRLARCRIANAVRCVPPENKPESVEITNCRPFLQAELGALPALKAILALGQLAHKQVLTTLGERQVPYPFIHGRQHLLSGGIILADSYHCSRYNTNTGRLTTGMFEEVVSALVPILE